MLIILALLLLIIPILDFSVGVFPRGEYIKMEELNLKKISELEGVVEVLDSNGKLLNGDKKYNIDDFLANKSDSKTRYLYKTDNGYILVSFPKNRVHLTNTMSTNSVNANGVIFLIWLIIYMVILFILVKNLYKKIDNEIIEIHKQEEEKRKMIFSGLAHDLKTPLTAILTYTKALRQDIVPENEKIEYLDTIIDQGKILEDRTKSLVMMSSLEGMDSLNNMVEGDILLYSYEKIMGLKNIIESLGYKLNIKIDKNDIFIVKYNKELWYQGIENIVFNTVNHNPKGTVLNITWDSKFKSLIFEDNGIGIDEDKLNIIKNPFITADESRTNLKLNGVGLASTERILNLHNWELIIESENGTRTIFKYMG